MPEKSPDSSPFWAPSAYADRRPILLTRGRIVAGLRAWFADQGFVEVETGALQVSPGNETHLHAFATALTAPDGTVSPFYLRTSPEFTCKKLLAAGERNIVEFAKVFRNRERGALHHPEFTMIEWCRAGAKRRRDRRCAAIQFSRPRRRSVRRAGAGDGCRSVQAFCRYRSAGD